MTALEKLKNLILGESPQPLNLQSVTEEEWSKTLAPTFSSMGERQAISGGDFPSWLNQASPHIIEAYRAGYAQTLQKLRTLRPIYDDNGQKVWVKKEEAAELKEAYIQAARAKMSEEEKFESVKTLAYFLADNKIPVNLEAEVHGNPKFSHEEKRVFLETYELAQKENAEWDGKGLSPGITRFLNKLGETNKPEENVF